MKIFYFKGTELSNAESLLSLFDEETQIRLHKKGNPRAKFQSLTAHALSLYAAAALDKKELLPQRNIHGQPVFLYNGIPVSDLYLSCAHTNNMTIASVCDWPIGVDVEIIAPWKKRVSQRMFHPLENMLLEESAQPDLVFTQIWTLRESYGKMLGTGILNLPCVSLLPSETDIICSDKTCSLWTGFIEGFVVSAVWKKPSKMITAADLIPVSAQNLETYFFSASEG